MQRLLKNLFLKYSTNHRKKILKKNRVVRKLQFLNKFLRNDTGTLLDLPLMVIDNKKRIGKLTTADMQRQLAFCP